MDVVETRLGERLVMRIVGRVDGSVAKALEEKLCGAIARGDRVIVDLAAMNYVSSAGLRAFLLAKRAAGDERHIVLCAMRPEVDEVFTISGAKALFKVYDTAELAAADIA